jgi:hypothetical protein
MEKSITSGGGWRKSFSSLARRSMVTCEVSALLALGLLKLFGVSTRL